MLITRNMRISKIVRRQLPRRSNNKQTIINKIERYTSSSIQKTKRYYTRMSQSTSNISSRVKHISELKTSPSRLLYIGLAIIPTTILFVNECDDMKSKSIVHAGFFDSNTSSKLKKQSFQKVDGMYDSGKWDELHENMTAIYESSDKMDAEIIWRYARATYEMSKKPDVQKDTKKKNAFVYEAFEAIKLGLTNTPNHFKIHLWYGILLNSVGEIEGSSVKIKNLPTVKEHWIKASKLNPKDGTALNLLGRWCKGIVEIDWISRQVANTIFGTIPTTSYEEALSFFLKAENLEPGFYLSNQLSIAQCLIAMKRKDEAKEWLLNSLNLPVVTEEDKADRKEVEKLLAKM